MVSQAVSTLDALSAVKSTPTRAERVDASSNDGAFAQTMSMAMRVADAVGAAVGRRGGADLPHDGKDVPPNLAPPQRTLHANEATQARAAGSPIRHRHHTAAAADRQASRSLEAVGEIAVGHADADGAQRLPLRQPQQILPADRRQHALGQDRIDHPAARFALGAA